MCQRVCSFEWGLEETSPVAPGLSTGGLLCFLPFLSFRLEVSVLSRPGGSEHQDCTIKPLFTGLAYLCQSIGGKKQKN